MDTHDANWWTFQATKADDDWMMPEMVFLPLPPHERPRRDISYGTYLQLDGVLSAQRPLTRTPDERAFIVTHQIFELTFKLMLFDLAVIERALWKALDIKGDEAFKKTVFPAKRPAEGNDFTNVKSTWREWVAAITASNRLRYCAEKLLPAYFGIITGEQPPEHGGSTTQAAPTFDSDQFLRFRSRVPPASGFQSAQFRALQRVLGKAPLLDVAYFDMHLYARNYQNDPPQARMESTHNLVSVDHEGILREERATARPTEDSPASWPQQLEKTAIALLERIARVMDLPPVDSEIGNVDSEMGNLVGLFKQMVRPGTTKISITGDAPVISEEMAQNWESAFEETVRKALSERRDSAEARAAFSWLTAQEAKHPITHCLRQILKTDELLFSEQNLFLQHHHATAIAAGLPEADTGSAGGGHAFLLLSKELNRRFPALFALR